MNTLVSTQRGRMRVALDRRNRAARHVAALMAITFGATAVSGCQERAFVDEPVVDESVVDEQGRDATARRQLCIVRHAEAWKNVEARRVDMSDLELDTLTPNGEEQARRLRAQLPMGPKRVVSSPTHRTQQTAALLEPGAAVEVSASLRPLDGAVSWDARTRAWSTGQDPRPDDGESLADGQTRVRTLLADVKSRPPTTTHVVLVTHGDIASLVLGELRGTPLLERPRVDVVNTGQMLCVPFSP
jgi:broad specificity phosphatase PhoE